MLVGVVRIVHPFPSLLDALVTGALVLIAGGGPAVALRLGLAMLAIQGAIGTVNDVVDAPLDAGRKSGKPLPRALLGRQSALALAATLALIGLALSVPSGPAVFVVAVAGLLVGLAYDLILKGTVWSWLPFAVGVPLLPVFAWLGATSTLPGSFALLIPAAFVAGAGLAIANLLADLERDRASGVDTVATRLGARRAWVLDAALMAGVIAAAAVSLAVAGGRGWAVAVAVVGAVVIVAGVALSRGGPAAVRERAWECQAAGVGILGAGWVAALHDAGAL